MLPMPPAYCKAIFKVFSMLFNGKGTERPQVDNNCR